MRAIERRQAKRSRAMTEDRRKGEKGSEYIFDFRENVL